MIEEDYLSESCLTCKNYDGMAHWDKGEKFCPHYPDKMSLNNYDIMGGYKCEYYDRKKLIVPAYKDNESINMRPVLIIDLSRFNSLDDIIKLLGKYFDGKGDFQINK